MLIGHWRRTGARTNVVDVQRRHNCERVREEKDAVPQPQHEHAETSSCRSMRARENQQDAVWKHAPWPQDAWAS